MGSLLRGQRSPRRMTVGCPGSNLGWLPRVRTGLTPISPLLLVRAHRLCRARLQQRQTSPGLGFVVARAVLHLPWMSVHCPPMLQDRESAVNRSIGLSGGFLYRYDRLSQPPHRLPLSIAKTPSGALEEPDVRSLPSVDALHGLPSDARRGEAVRIRPIRVDLTGRGRRCGARMGFSGGTAPRSRV